jgi:MraZ protein
MAGAGPVAGAAGELPLGRYSGKLDDKGRLKLPAVFQEYLGGLDDKRLFVTSLDGRTAAIYPIAVWRANLKRFGSYPKDPGAISAVVFNANDLGTEEKMDNQGRILLNSDLRTELGLEDKSQLHMQARNGHIEIITDAVYQQMRALARNRAMAAAELLLGDGFA